MATMPMKMQDQSQEEYKSKCFAIWVNEDGTASLAEIPPDRAEILKDEVDLIEVKDQSEAMQLLAENMPNPRDMSDEMDVMRGYEKNKPQRKENNSPQAIFGE